MMRDVLIFFQIWFDSISFQIFQHLLYNRSRVVYLIKIQFPISMFHLLSFAVHGLKLNMIRCSIGSINNFLVEFYTREKYSEYAIKMGHFFIIRIYYNYNYLECIQIFWIVTKYDKLLFSFHVLSWNFFFF